MGRAIAVRTDYTSGEVRRQARRLLAIAAVLDGSSREEAARLGGMDGRRSGLGDRFNAQGPERLIKIPLPARRPSSRLAQGLLRRVVEEARFLR